MTEPVLARRPTARSIIGEIAIGEGSPISGGVPASIVSDRSKTDTDRSV